MKLPFSLWRHLGLRLSLGLLLLLGMGLLMGAQSHLAHAASTLTVSDCSSDSQLQADVKQANTDNENDTITFSCGGDIQLSSTLTISGSMTLDGSGHSVTLDGQNQVQVLQVRSGVSFTLNALTLTNGSAGSHNSGGAISNAGTMTISGSTLSNNSAGSGNGGAILNTSVGKLTISNSTFVGNFAGEGDGGAIVNNYGTETISNSTFANNSTGDGGSGGGIANYGTETISNSTIVNNSAGYEGSGGGILNYGTETISNSTIANNSAGYSASGGGIYTEGGTVTISGSIVAKNTASRGNDCFNYNLSGSITDNGYNLESGTDCGFTDTGSLQNTDPELDASGLQNNGGSTQTFALQSSSPAIDHIPTASCPATDQRGMTRPDNGETTCDIGAYEFVDPVDNDLGLSGLPSNITVNATSPQGAVVTYTAPTATDESGDNPGPTASCDPASGSTFPIGTTKVTCTATDSDDSNSPVSQSFTVTVKDVTPPTLSLPSTITMDATSPQGASVSYAVTATDPDNAASDLTISCSPASGSTFAIGTTTVKCSASDPAGNKATGSFQVVVKGAAAQVSDLMTTVNSYHLSGSLQTSLDNKLQDVLTAINGGQTATACSELTDFIGHVQSQSGKGLTTDRANQLITAAQRIRAVLGC